MASGGLVLRTYVQWKVRKFAVDVAVVMVVVAAAIVVFVVDVAAAALVVAESYNIP